MAKKKEDKINDYSTMSEEEKLALLAEYKKMYQLQIILKEQGISFDNDKLVLDESVTSSGIKNNEKIVITEIETEVNDKLEDAKETIVDEKEETIIEEEIEIEEEIKIEDEAEIEEEIKIEDEIEIAEETEIEIEVHDIEEETEVDIDIVMIDDIDSESDNEKAIEMSEGKEVLEDNNIDVNKEYTEVNKATLNRRTKDAAFEYSSFTPYKPTFDNLDLDNNMFAFGDRQISTTSSDEYVEKYQMKSKPHTALKTSQDGRYKYSDNYIATKTKRIIPVFNILVVLFSIISLTVSVTGMVYCFNNFLYTECVLNLVFAISVFMIGLSATSKDEGINKIAGFTVIAVTVIDVIIAALAKYQDYLYMIISPENDSDRVTGIIMLLTLIVKYSFFISMFVYFNKKNKQVLYVSVVLGMIAVVLTIVTMVNDMNNGTLIKYYNVLPATIAIISYNCALIFSGIEREKR